MKRRIWASDWFAGLAYGAAFLLVAYVIFPTGFQRLENTAYDLGIHLTHIAPSKQKAVIAINIPPVMVLAHVVSSLLQQHFFTVLAWASRVTLAALLLLIIYTAFLLPHIKPAWGAVITLLLVIVLCSVEFGYMRTRTAAASE